MFKMKKTKESKRKHWVPEFFHKQEEKIPLNNLTIKLADRESFLVKVYFFLSMSFEIPTFLIFLGIKLLASRQNKANLRHNQ